MPKWLKVLGMILGAPLLLAVLPIYGAALLAEKIIEKK